MKQFKIFFTTISLLFVFIATAQTKSSDSTQVAKALKALLSACKNVDTKTTSAGAFNKAAAYIIYKGDDEGRNWKDFANYSNVEEKNRVDKMCMEINQTVNQDGKYIITGYRTENESEGKWHILEVSYRTKKDRRFINLAFLKVNGKFGLGDIN